MHILHIVQIYHPAPSGAARYFIEIGERLVRDGHRVTVLAANAFDLEHFWMEGKRSIAERTSVHAGVQIRRFPVQRLPGPPLLYPVLRRAMLETSRLPGTLPLLRRMALLTPRLPTLWRYLETAPELRDVDLVHTTNITLDFAIVPTQDWARRRAIPHIVTPFVHLGEPHNPQIVQYYTMPHQIEILKQSAAVLTMTDLERAYLLHKGVANELLHTVGAGVTPESTLGGDATRFRHEQRITGPIVLTMDTAAFDKGTVHVVEALRRLWARGVEVTWVQCGSLMDHFEKFYATLSDQEQARTRLLGFVPRATLHDALAAATVYAMPSRTDSFGIAYLEAWCYGLPVIGANAGGVPDVITHGANGLLVPFGDVEALAAAIMRLLQDEALRQAMGAVGKDTVRHSMTWDVQYTRVRRVIEGVVAQRHNILVRGSVSPPAADAGRWGAQARPYAEATFRRAVLVLTAPTPPQS
ncbi:glycosyltransferase family 4 protein [Candidatus Gracilibacteria bacterium]|nr:glycosyltransferase family 4 protein [Candidatus Gracilibacteria bacterium]